VGAERLSRHPADWLRFSIAVALTLATAVLARQGRPSVVEINLFRLVNELPSAVHAPLLGAMQLGALGAVPVFAGVALLRNRPRLARGILVAGTAAWLVAKVLQRIIDQEPPEIVLPNVLLHGATQAGLAFPATHVAVAAAMATVAGPYLSRPNRRLAWLGVAVIAVARVYVGAHFPVDVVGGAAVGWGIGSLVLLCLGSPRGLPNASNVQSLMTENGYGASSAAAIESDGSGTAVFRVELDDATTLVAKVIGRDEQQADWLYRTWRLLVFRELDERAVGVSPIMRAEHEAYLLLLAERAGLCVPTVKVTQPVGDDEALLLRSWVSGARLADLADGEVSDTALIALWRALDAFHRAGIALGAIRLTDIVVSERDEVGVVDLSTGRVSANPEDRARDIAELYALIGHHVGASRAIGTAATVFTDDELRSALRFVQPLALSQSTRRLVARRRGYLEEARRELAAKVGVDPSPIQLPSRIAARNLVPLIGALFAVNLLLPQVGQAAATWTALGNASVPWLFATAAAGALTYLMAAIALIGAAGHEVGPHAVAEPLQFQVPVEPPLRVLLPEQDHQQGAQEQQTARAGGDRCRPLPARPLPGPTGGGGEHDEYGNGREDAEGRGHPIERSIGVVDGETDGTNVFLDAHVDNPDRHRCLDAVLALTCARDPEAVRAGKWQ
jgi:undecaprenyl-diphosphatase